VSITATGVDTLLLQPDTVTIEVPPEHAMISPPASSVLPRDAILLTWSGGDGQSEIELKGYFFLKINESEAGYQMEDLHELRCKIIDDGSFEIPAEIVELTPVGYWLNGSISTEILKDREIAPGFVIKTKGIAMAQFSYQLE